jgi:hypothetical protein
MLATRQNRKHGAQDAFGKELLLAGKDDDNPTV